MAESTSCSSSSEIAEIREQVANIANDVSGLRLNLGNVQQALDSIPTEIEELLDHLRLEVPDVVRHVVEATFAASMLTLSDEVRQCVSTVTKSAVNLSNTVAATEESLTSYFNAATESVRTATNLFSGEVNASVTQAKSSLEAAGAAFEKELEKASTAEMKAFKSLAEGQLKQVTTGVTSLFNALSMSYSNWIAEALQAAKLKTDASFYAQELSEAVSGLAQLIDRVSEAQLIITAVDNMAEQVDRLTKVHAQIVPHLEEFSNVAGKAVATSWTDVAKDVAITAGLLKQLLHKEQRRLV